MQEIIKISDNLSVPRVLIGLWQIADMEKDGKTLDPSVTSKYMNIYAKNGFNNKTGAMGGGKTRRITRT